MTIEASDSTGQSNTERPNTRVLIIGATGLLGRVLLEVWDLDKVTGVGAKTLDIRDESQLSDLFLWTRPEWTVLAAAYTDVDGCEKDRQLAFQVNCLGAINVARQVARTNSKLLFVSTDYVFDGTKNAPYDTDDSVCPINVYGESKAEAEQRIREILPECCIVRTSWLFGAVGRCFPNKILDLASSENTLRVVADQVGNPTFNRDLARAIIHLVRAGATGIVHATNTGACSWYDFAREILATGGYKNVKVEAVRTEEMPRPAPRPKYSVLSIASAKRYQIEMRHWREALADYFADRLAVSDRGKAISARSAMAHSVSKNSKEGQ
jgi:dTDP-4-dehydrorhamnose reductase